jgi:hypothetical protein
MTDDLAVCRPQPGEVPTLRAAYADRTAALMAFLARFAYDPRIEAKGPLEVPRELAELGFTSMTSFHNGMVNGWAYVAERADLIALCFRGAASIKNWETAFQVGLVHPDGTDVRLRVHKGFYSAFIRLDEGTSGIKEVVDAIKVRTQGRLPIYITGHSLGGALAQIAAAVLESDQVAACYTFGSPRVGNLYFDLWVKVPSYRVMNYADIVPEVPLPVIYRHSGDARYIPGRVAGSPYRFQPGAAERIWQFILAMVQFVAAGSVLGVKDHAILEYCRKLDEIAEARTHGR